jgi:DNA-binding MarR family transcriptional regulator
LSEVPPSPEQAEALRLIRALVAALSRSARTVEQRTGVTNAQLFLLRELAADRAMSINDLAARALTGQNTVSMIVARLVEQGLVNRRRSEDDARRVEVRLTTEGRRLVNRAPEPPTARLLHAIRRMPRAELRALNRSLGALARLMELPEHDGERMLFDGTPASRGRSAPARRRRASS